MKNIVLSIVSVIFLISTMLFIKILVTSKFAQQINIGILTLISLCMIGFVLSIGFIDED